MAHSTASWQSWVLKAPSPEFTGVSTTFLSNGAAFVPFFTLSNTFNTIEITGLASGAAFTVTVPLNGTVSVPVPGPAEAEIRSVGNTLEARAFNGSTILSGMTGTITG